MAFSRWVSTSTDTTASRKILKMSLTLCFLTPMNQTSQTQNLNRSCKMNQMKGKRIQTSYNGNKITGTITDIYPGFVNGEQRIDIAWAYPVEFWTGPATRSSNYRLDEVTLTD